ncbi:MAG: delta-class carbonic anhydrase [Rhodospirillaceae bacterium]
MSTRLAVFSLASVLITTPVFAESGGGPVSDDVIAEQRAALAAATDGKGFGPQSPRDIDAVAGTNSRAFSTAPLVTEMTLCDIHFHENAEHKGGVFRLYAGNGDGKGYGTGFKYSGELTEAELAPVPMTVGDSPHGDLVPGDTIEIHFVHSTAQATLGPSLATCLSEAIGNPQLRVEAVVAVLVATGGEDFVEMTRIEDIDGLNQVPNLPNDLGEPVVYSGSTTGPGYNMKGSPFQVTWSVRPDVVKLNIASVDAWLKDNPFGEDHAHGVRNLVTNPDLLSQIE